LAVLLRREPHHSPRPEWLRRPQPQAPALRPGEPPSRRFGQTDLLGRQRQRVLRGDGRPAYARLDARYRAETPSPVSGSRSFRAASAIRRPRFTSQPCFALLASIFRDLHRAVAAVQCVVSWLLRDIRTSLVKYSGFDRCPSRRL
jgi:hypothetical protein